MRPRRTLPSIVLCTVLLAACGSGNDPVAGGTGASPPAPEVPSEPTGSPTPAFVDVRPEPGLYGDEVVAAIPTGLGTAQIVLTDDAVWVTQFSSGRVTRYDATTMQETANISAGTRTGGMTAGPRFLWASSDSAGGKLHRIDIATGELLETTSLPGSFGLVTDGDVMYLWDPLQQSGVIARPGAAGWILRRADVDTGEVLGQIELNADAGTLAANGDELFITSLEGRILRLDASSMAITESVAVDHDIPSGNSAEVIGDELVIATKGRLDVYDTATLTHQRTITLDGALDVEATRAADGSLYLATIIRPDPRAATTASGLWRIDIANGDAVTGPIRLGTTTVTLAVGHDAVWASDFQDAVVLRVPLEAL